MDLKRIEKTEVLYGLRLNQAVNDLWDPVRKVTIPVQSSPLSEYVNDVNRFLFSGGITLDSDLPSDHPAQLLAEKFSAKCIKPYLNSIWESVAIAGELLAVIRISSGQYSLEWFDPREYTLKWEKGELEKISVKTRVEIDGTIYIYRFDIDSRQFWEYPLVKEPEAGYYDWEKNKTITDHGLGRLPAHLIKVNPSIKTRRGCSEFPLAALNLSQSICTIEYGLDENLYFFGNPFFDSPDPRATIKDLNEKRQVLQKLPNDEGGGHTLLQPQTLSGDELAYLQFKKESFKRLMGITNTQETRLTDASGVALRIMNDGLISKAQVKWVEVVDDGLEGLTRLFMNCAHQAGLVVMPLVDPNFSYHRSEPFFIQTEAERLQSLDVAERLFDMGLDRAIALQLTVFPHLGIGQIEEMFSNRVEE